MKTPLITANVTLLNSPTVLPAPDALTDTTPMMLTEVEDHDLQRLPAIHPPPRPHGVRRTSSACFQRPAKVDYVLQFNKASSRARSLVDIHEESTDTDAPSSTTSEETSEKETWKFQAPCVPSAQTRLLESRQRLQKQSCTSPSLTPRHSYVRRVDQHTVLPNKHPRYLKSLSQRTFREEEKDNSLPSIYPDRDPHPSQLRNRSLSATSFLPRSLPLLDASRSKSTSQPDVSRPSGLLASSHSACDLTESRKQRIQRLWQRAGHMLKPPPKASVEEPVSWVEAPGEGRLRPLYSRWPHRRHALAEPERMCMTQPIRERILKDVEIRKRSVKRKVSQFFTVKLGLNMEEDLIA